MLNRDGIAAFSLRALSQELGVSHAAAYRHFKNREDLIKEIFREASHMFRDALSATVSPEIAGEEALIRLGVGYVRFFLDHPETLILFNLNPAGQPLLQDVFSDADEARGAFELFRGIAAGVREFEPYRALSEREILLGFWSKVHGLSTILVTQKGFIPEADIPAVVERLMRTPF